MHIKSLTLKNYRCYEELQVDFNKEYTILVGVNGAGKSTILDAVSTALGSFIAGFDGITSNGITRDDAHRKMFELGSRVDTEEQYPVEISAMCDLGEREISWTRSLHSKDGRTHISKAKEIMEYGSKLQKSVLSLWSTHCCCKRYGKNKKYRTRISRRFNEFNSKF